MQNGGCGWSESNDGSDERSRKEREEAPQDGRPHGAARRGRWSKKEALKQDDEVVEAESGDLEAKKRKVDGSDNSAKETSQRMREEQAEEENAKSGRTTREAEEKKVKARKGRNRDTEKMLDELRKLMRKGEEASDVALANP